MKDNPFPFRTIAAGALALFAVLCIIGHCAGCALFGGGGKEGAEAAYTAALVRCVDKAETLAESRACRASVDSSWGIKDGGTQ